MKTEVRQVGGDQQEGGEGVRRKGMGVSYRR